MRTKEEILSPIHGHCPEELELVYLHEDVLKAMDEYAKEVAVGFSKAIHYYENDHVRTEEQIFDNWLSIVNASTNQIK